MELRSRSRSKTPFQTENFIEAESYTNDSNITVTRSSKRTTTIKSTTTSGNATSNQQFYTTKPTTRTKSTKSKQNILVSPHKTSDYSSEEGEIESVQHITENDKNKIIEDAIAAANGTADISALNLYRKAGRYWDKYPKTDYTYSPHSRDRIEIAPGIVQMPNMSRRTIHAYDTSTNTDSYLEQNFIKSRYMNELASKNNNYDEVDESYRLIRPSTSSTSVVSSTFVRIYTVIFWCLRSIYQVSNSATISILKKLHHFTSRVMLLDTWLLKKSIPGKRTKAVVALCLLPVLLFAGFHVLLASGVSLAPFCHPHCGRYIATYYNSFINAASNIFQ